jgi:type III pantothenate kinase
MLLAADLGNSRLRLGLFDLAQTPPFEPLTAAFIPLPPRDGLLPIDTDVPLAEDVDAAVLASVNPPHEPAVREWLRERFGCEPRCFPLDVPPGLENRCRPPERVGADRLAAACAAWSEVQAACVVVDVGTAITVDAVSPDGAFLGGAILPGLRLLAESLAENTAQLPNHASGPPQHTIGPDTASAIASGLWLGTAGAIDRLVADIGAEMGADGAALITGGDAEPLLRCCRTPFAHRPALTLQGLAAAWDAARD